MTLSSVKLGSAVTFMKHFASVFFLIFLTKTIISWNKITLRPSNLLNLAELVVNELTKSISKKNSPLFLFRSDLSLLIVNTSGTITKEQDNFTKSSSV